MSTNSRFKLKPLASQTKGEGNTKRTLLVTALAMSIAIMLMTTPMLTRQAEAKPHTQTQATFSLGNVSNFETKIADWILNSGILQNNTVHEGVHYNASNNTWQLCNYTRIDAQCEAALALLSHCKKTGNPALKNTAITLLKQARADSLQTNNGEPWQCTTKNFYSCYTQDNGRQLRAYAYAAKETNDPEITQTLTQLANFWTSQIPDHGGLGVGKDLYANFLPDKYPCARHISEMLVGMTQTYETLNTITYRTASIKLGNWLTNNQFQNGTWKVPPRWAEPNYNGGVGNIIEATSLSLWGLSELYKITGNNTYKTSATKAYNWILNQCIQTDNNWHLGRLPSEANRATDLRYFNTLYMQTPTALVSYYEHCNRTSSILELALEITTFMCTTMTMHGNSLVEGGITGEWDLSQNTRSTYVDNEQMTWGDWIYTGWTNCETIEAITKMEPCKCDINKDGQINILDLIKIATNLGWTGPPGTKPEDINQDGKINVLDLIRVSKHLGW